MVDILIPTYNRLQALTATLTSLCCQHFQDFSVVIANQGDPGALEKSPSLRCVAQLLELHGNSVQIHHNFPRRGIAQQRHFLLEQATAPYCLFLDDDVVLEPFVLSMLVSTLKGEACGFVGNGLIGLSYQGKQRPKEEEITLWKGRVHPETITPESPEWKRHSAHNAANILHIQQKLEVSPHAPILYKVAWIGGCVLYDTEKLRSVGGFSFWRDLPRDHCGEDVLVQLRLLKRFGGCGVLPSGAYHQELPTTITNRKVDAPLCLPI